MTQRKYSIARIYNIATKTHGVLAIGLGLPNQRLNKSMHDTIRYTYKPSTSTSLSPRGASCAPDLALTPLFEPTTYLVRILGIMTTASIFSLRTGIGTDRYMKGSNVTDCVIAPRNDTIPQERRRKEAGSTEERRQRQGRFSCVVV